MIIVLNLWFFYLFFMAFLKFLNSCLIMRGWCSCSYWMSFWKNTSMLMTSQWRCYWSHATVFPAPPSVVVQLCLYRAGMCGMFWGSHQVTALWFVSTVRVKPALTETKLVYIVNRGFPEAPRRASAAAVGPRTCSGGTVLFYGLGRWLLANGGEIISPLLRSNRMNDFSPLDGIGSLCLWWEKPASASRGGLSDCFRL